MLDQLILSRIERDIKTLEKNLSFLKIFLEDVAKYRIGNSKFAEIFGGIASAVYLSASMRILSLSDKSSKYPDDANLYKFLNNDTIKKQELDNLLSKHQNLLDQERNRRHKMNAHTTISPVDSIPLSEFLDLGFDVMDFAISTIGINLNESDIRRESYDTHHEKLLELIGIQIPDYQ